jgi:hypothetical protein
MSQKEGITEEFLKFASDERNTEAVASILWRRQFLDETKDP